MRRPCRSSSSSDAAVLRKIFSEKSSRASPEDNAIRKFSPNGTDLGIFANTGLANPAGIVFDGSGNLYVINYNYPNTGHSFIREFSSTGTDLGVPFGLAFSQQAAPTVESVQINDGSDQRSMVDSLTVTFSSVVTIDPGAFEVRHQNGALVTVNFTSSVVGDQTVALIRFTGAEIIGGSLADGNYTLTILADHVHDGAGNSLDADNFTSFYRLFGDTQGHRTVDAADVDVLFSTFGKHTGDPGFVSCLDFYGSGVIDDASLYAFIARYGTTLNR